MHQHNRPPVPPPVPRQAEPDIILGRHIMVFRLRQPKIAAQMNLPSSRPDPGGRKSAVEVCERPAQDFPHDGSRATALPGLIARGALDGPQLTEEIGETHGEDATCQPPALPLAAAQDIDVEPRCAFPEVGPHSIRHDLVAGQEKLLTAFCRRQCHAVIEMAGRLSVLLNPQDFKGAMRNFHRFARQDGTLHSPEDTRGPVGIFEKFRDVVDQHGEFGGKRRVRLFPRTFRLLIV